MLNKILPHIGAGVIGGLLGTLGVTFANWQLYAILLVYIGVVLYYRDTRW